MLILGNLFRVIVLGVVLYVVFTHMDDIQKFFDVQWNRGMKSIHKIVE